MEAPLTICVGQTPDKKKSQGIFTLGELAHRHHQRKTHLKGGPWSNEKDSLSIQGSPATNTDAHAHNDDGDRREKDLPPSHIQGHLIRPDSDRTYG